MNHYFANPRCLHWKSTPAATPSPWRTRTGKFFWFKLQFRLVTMPDFVFSSEIGKILRPNCNFESVLAIWCNFYLFWFKSTEMIQSTDFDSKHFFWFKLPVFDWNYFESNDNVFIQDCKFESGLSILIQINLLDKNL